MINFMEIAEGGIANTDKLLVCIIILLFITIVWTMLITIMFRMNERKYYYSKKLVVKDDKEDEEDEEEEEDDEEEDEEDTYFYDDSDDYDIEDDEDEEEIKYVKQEATKPVKVAKLIDSNLETYVKIRFYRSDRTLIYVAPKGKVLNKGDKIKVRIDEDTVRTAVVVKGNYTRKRYKNYNYKTLDLI